MSNTIVQLLREFSFNSDNFSDPCAYIWLFSCYRSQEVEKLPNPGASLSLGAGAEEPGVGKQPWSLG